MNAEDSIRTQHSRHPEYVASIRWKMGAGDFRKGKYSREHHWEFDGGITVKASPSPHVVPSPWSNPEAIDPEEAFVASIASCHMLTFLWLASKQGWESLSYEDRARGVMTKNARGVPWVSKVTLHPQIVWSEDRIPTATELQALHDEAHQQCFIANSVKTEIIVES